MRILAVPGRNRGRNHNTRTYPDTFADLWVAYLVTEHADRALDGIAGADGHSDGDRDAFRAALVRIYTGDRLRYDALGPRRHGGLHRGRAGAPAPRRDPHRAAAPAPVTA